jgi:hypothetical protein
MRATFIDSEGEYLEATVKVGDIELRVMDEFGGSMLAADTEIELDIFVGLAFEDESWESMFNSNPDCKKQLVHQSGWCYRAYGVVTQIQPNVLVDVGFTTLEAPISTNDINVVGVPMAFTINRLGANAS